MEELTKLMQKQSEQDVSRKLKPDITLLVDRDRSNGAWIYADLSESPLFAHQDRNKQWELISLYMCDQ